MGITSETAKVFKVGKWRAFSNKLPVTLHLSQNGTRKSQQQAIHQMVTYPDNKHAQRLNISLGCWGQYKSIENLPAALFALQTARAGGKSSP
jgi:hypothetical protein